MIRRTQLIPSRSLHYRQHTHTHLVTSVTIARWLPRQLMSSSSHFSPPSHAALNINSADNRLETVSAETPCTEQLKDTGPSSKTTAGQFAWQAERRWQNQSLSYSNCCGWEISASRSVLSQTGTSLKHLRIKKILWSLNPFKVELV